MQKIIRSFHAATPWSWKEAREKSTRDLNTVRKWSRDGKQVEKRSSVADICQAFYSTSLTWWQTENTLWWSVCSQWWSEVCKHVLQRQTEHDRTSLMTLLIDKASMYCTCSCRRQQTEMQLCIISTQHLVGSRRSMCYSAVLSVLVCPCSFLPSV